ncbi:hypothetical protein BH10ACT11_BH10ACT11_19400 [soil metagenome]
MIEVDHVSKGFRLPVRSADTLRERVVGRVRPTHRELQVLRDISFDIREGEFFGIAGRNGSGKSTLLKLIAGIYRPDRGQIRGRGRIAPVIELGIGFNPELPAYDNVVMNAVMTGLTPQEAKRRFGEIMEFAELGEYEYLKLKNYSSGMYARLAFSIMIHVDADLILFDEVLAVGDFQFQDKCGDVFREMRRTGKTAIFVSHQKLVMEELCDRAILLENGEIKVHGTPTEVGTAYEHLAALPPPVITAPEGSEVPA